MARNAFISETEGNEGAHERITKSEAARHALAVGYDKPQEAVASVLGRFGVEMGTQHFSSIKTGMKKGTSPTQVKPGRKPQTAPIQAVEGHMAPPPTQNGTVGEAELLEAMEAMKPLIARYGEEKLRRIVELLG